MFLVTDILFPSKYARWRMEECKAFIEEYQADFLVFKVDGYANIKYNVDYVEMLDYFNLSEYNIIIFDEKYNYLNKYNTKIDGTTFNDKKSVFSYLFTRNKTFDINQYTCVYHIFLSMYKRFNEQFKYPQEKQFVHLYPGGGLANKIDTKLLSKQCNVISTNPQTTTWLKDFGYSNYIEAHGSTLLPKNNTINFKQKNAGKMVVCFSNLGNSSVKGASVYKVLAEKYRSTYPKDEVQFIAIGNCLPSPAIKQYAPMSQFDLDKFYNTEVDVVINSESGGAFNGWPLGAEAILQGCVLITTDTHKSNNSCKFTNDMLFIIEIADIKKILNILKRLHTDRDLLFKMSNNIQKHSNELFSYKNQQQKIFDYIEAGSIKKNMEIYEKVCPLYFTNNTTFKIKSDIFPILEKTNVTIIDNNVEKLIFDNIKNSGKLSIARYNDGEWIAMLKITHKNLYNVHKVKWNDNAEIFAKNNLMPIVSGSPSYYIGVSTEVLKKDYMVKPLYPFIKNFTLCDGGLFARWSIDGKIIKLLEQLKGKHVIVIGPEYLSNLTRHIEMSHIITKNNVWDDYKTIHDSIENIIQENSVLLYSCSFVAKKLIDDFHQLNIIQLDIGAAFDSICGERSRPWH